jgi:hypothetical protein
VEPAQHVRGAADVVATLGKPIHLDQVKVDDEEFEPLASRVTPA